MSKESVATTKSLWRTLEVARTRKPPRVSTFLEMKASRLARECCASTCDQRRRRLACVQGPEAGLLEWTPAVDPEIMFSVFPRFALGRFSRAMEGVGGGGPQGQLGALKLYAGAGCSCCIQRVIDCAYGKGGRVSWAVKADPEGCSNPPKGFPRVQVPGVRPAGSGFWVCGVSKKKGRLGALHTARASP